MCIRDSGMTVMRTVVEVFRAATTLKQRLETVGNATPARADNDDLRQQLHAAQSELVKQKNRVRNLEAETHKLHQSLTALAAVGNTDVGKHSGGGGVDGGSTAVPVAATAVRARKQSRSETNAKRFDLHIDFLKQYKENNDGRDPPRDFSMVHEGEQITLGKWCHNQRQKKNKHILAKEYVDKLDALDFAWGGSPESVWKEYFALLKEYKEQHNNQDPPTTYIVERNGRTLNIGTWCRTQRYRRNSHKLNKSRRDQLDGVDFQWGRSPDNAFDEFFEALKAHREEHGACVRYCASTYREHLRTYRRMLYSARVRAVPP